MPFIEYQMIDEETIQEIIHMEQLPCCQAFPEYIPRLEHVIVYEMTYSFISDEEKEMICKLIPPKKIKIEQFIRLVVVLFKATYMIERVSGIPVIALSHDFRRMLTAENLIKIMQHYQSDIPFIIQELHGLQQSKIDCTQKHFDEMLSFIDDRQRKRAFLGLVSQTLERKESSPASGIHHSQQLIMAGDLLLKKGLFKLPLQMASSSKLKELRQIEEKASILEFNTPAMRHLFYRFPTFSDNLRSLGRYLYKKLNGNWHAVCDVFTELAKVEVHIAEAISFIYMLEEHKYTKTSPATYYINESHLKNVLDVIVNYQKTFLDSSLTSGRTEDQEKEPGLAEFLELIVNRLKYEDNRLLEGGTPTAADYIEETARLYPWSPPHNAFPKDPHDAAIQSILSVFLAKDSPPSKKMAKPLFEKDVYLTSLFSCISRCDKTFLGRDPKEGLEEEEQKSAYTPGKSQYMS